MRGLEVNCNCYGSLWTELPTAAASRGSLTHPAVLVEARTAYKLYATVAGMRAAEVHRGRTGSNTTREHVTRGYRHYKHAHHQPGYVTSRDTGTLHVPSRDTISSIT